MASKKIQILGGFPVSDWNQSDETKTDYIKNKTHYIYSAFEPITWDGNTEGRDSFILQLGTMSFSFYKVSDRIITASEVLGGTACGTHFSDGHKTCVTIVDTSDDPFADGVVTTTDYGLQIGMPCHCFNEAGTYTLLGEEVEVPSAGVYFFIHENGYQSSIEGPETVKTLDPKYLPMDDIKSAVSYTLPSATSDELGGVITGDNITNVDGTISITKDNITSALGYTPIEAYDVATDTSDGLLGTADKIKLDGVEDGAQKNIQADFNQTDETKSDYIKNKPNLDNYITNEELASALNMTEDICYMDAGSIAEEGDDIDG